jgi:cellulose synthase/poly-beta-1,6-N-acetylglucosamine synthase-like glycosyltransferase
MADGAFRWAQSARDEGNIEEAVWGLLRASPRSSAFCALEEGQKRWAAVALSAALASALIAPAAALVTLNALAAVYFLVAVGFRLVLAIAATNRRRTDPAPPVADESLPTVTILLPVFREAEGLPLLAQSIGALDYPAAKLDVKLLLEADDRATIAEARKLGLDRLFQCVIVPPYGPRTKPKACNYGLTLSKGDLVVIYDAEDCPEPDQLRKAAALFAQGDRTLACVQARLNFYNAGENLLTQLFAVEYALWFDMLLPGLERLRIPIPLGGTSNVFRVDMLREIGGWDPFNVTEDADLGLRIARRGYRTAVLDSSTLEEANCRLGNWLRQRSRWMKGYMQTWLVHLREQSAMARATGLRGLTALHLFVLGNFFGALAMPVLLAFSIMTALLPRDVVPAAVETLNLVSLVVGNALYVGLAAAAALQRGWRRHAACALLAPFYWQLASIAAYRALHQLLTRPSYWEKTEHVLSAIARRRRSFALAALSS